ncbi:MAG: TolC family protein, partial [Desulfobacterales bacterium]|nr:TolC family protein [Desulfobacterales bacterium]
QFDIRFAEGGDLDGDWTADGVRRSLSRAMSDADIDLVITLGHVASDMACGLDRIEKPVIAPLIIDAITQGLPMKDGTSGVSNLNYINRLKSVDRDIQAFRNIVPFRRLAFLADGYLLRAMPALEKEIGKLAFEYSIELDIVRVEASAERALADLPPGTDAVVISPLFRLDSGEFQLLADGLSQREIPSFSFWGRDEVRLGVLATITPAGAMDHLARSVAVNVLETLEGVEVGALPVTFSMDEQLTINMATARAVGVYPSLSALTEADLLNEERRDVQRVLTIEEAVKEAAAANLDLVAADREVAAGAEAVSQAKSALLPQLDVGTSAGLIDDDRARAGAGSAPERTWTGSATASQLIYSEKAWSNWTAQKHLQNAREQSRESLRLDIVQSAAAAYINVLRARAIEKIQKENLKLTRANLQRARVRLNVGAAGPDEVYRWESQIASSRRAVLDAESVVLDAMNHLNRILHRPLQEPFTVSDVKSDALLFMESKWRFTDLVDNTRSLRALKAFLVREGVEFSPELQSLNAQMAARERVLVSAKRELWLPTFSIQGGVTQLLSEGGDGQRGNSMLDLDDTDWQVGVHATLPLYSGGRKTATVRRAREELALLRARYDATSERVQQRVLFALNRSRASAPGVRLSRDAADAAERNLKLVLDSYSRGIKSIIDLLDAQNLVLVANQQAANANYDFLTDVIGVQRAVGKFGMLSDPEERKTWMQNLDDYLMKEGIEPESW